MANTVNRKLGDLIPMIYTELGELNVSRATGGSTTTVLDSTLVDLYENNIWKNGTVFILFNLPVDPDSPNHGFSRISEFESNNGGSAKFTLSDALPDGVASGDTYGYASSKYPLRQSIWAINEALRELGPVPLVDTDLANMTIVAAQTEYALRPSMKFGPPIRIDIQGNVSDSDDNDWREVPVAHWQFVPSDGGSDGKIIFDYQLPVGHKLRYWTWAVHPELNSYSNRIHESLDFSLVALKATERLLVWKSTQQGGSDAFLLQKLADVRSRLNNMRVEQPIWKPRRSPRLLITGDYHSTDNFTWPSP